MYTLAGIQTRNSIVVEANATATAPRRHCNSLFICDLKFVI
jgi:hypothetical protein